jgi:hypothetical protein
MSYPKKSRFSPETTALMVGWVYGFCAGALAMLVWRAVCH